MIKMSLMKDCLNNWGYSQFIEKFVEEEIDDVAFSNLQYETLKDLIPKAGPRQQFWICYKKHMCISNELATTSSATFSEASLSQTENLDINFPITEVSISDKLLDNNLGELIGSSIIFGQSCTNSKSTTNTVEDYLKCANGSIVSNYYKKNKTLTRKERNILSNVIVQKEFETCPQNFKISTERFKQITEDILKIFPTENADIYYIPYQPKTKALASGKLWECYNRLKKNIRRTLTPLHENKIEEKSTVEKPSDSSGQIFFLKNNLEPWDKISSYWNDTFQYRMNLLKSSISKLTIHQYLHAFPALRGPKGWCLLCNDFEQLYPNCINKLFSEWSEVNHKLINKAKFECPDVLKKFGENDLTGFLLLPGFLGSCAYTRQSGTKKRIKFTKDEVLNAFILQIENGNLLDEELEKLKTKLRENKETLQPTVIIVGETFDNISASHVVIDDVVYTVNSPLIAIDLCFKSFSALNAKFPTASSAIWLYIQQRVYGIKTEYDSRSVVVSSLLSDTN